jgi:hypothetical protein
MGWAKVWAIFFTNSPGIYVIITIFCDFLPIFGEKIGVFLKTIVMIKCLQKVIAAI